MQEASSKPKILILHGWGGSDFPHWQSWLASELAKAGYPVYFPQLPFMHTPRKKVWLETLEQAIESFKPDRVVCHSLGNMLWFWYAKAYPKANFEKVLLVAPPARSTNIKAIDTFFPYPKAATLSGNALFVASTNDKYMNIHEAQELQKELGCEMKIIENGGHLNSDAGYGAWPFAYEWITA
ncbi:MAG TPA: alpha/beta hydrolase [Campylobacterales bacterium]|nr:alpha/beta hydrolase [Campylobacterales bacterium]